VTSGAVLALDGVTLRRSGRAIVDDVSWTVADGERWVVLGPNGAGKSSLLALASTFELPSRGLVHVLGHRIGRVDVRDLRPRIGYASDTLARLLAPEATAHETVVTAKLGALRAWRGGPARVYDDTDHARAAALLEELGVGDLGARTVGRLSQGERQRVQLARTLMAAPELLLLDEPSAGLDLGGRELLVRRLTSLRPAPGGALRAVVLVTHHLEEVPPGFTHAMLLRAGRVVAAGPIDEVLDDDPVSECFGLPLRVARRDGRHTAALAGVGVP